MTTTFAANQAVPSGTYFDAARWTMVPVAADGDRLPAGPGPYHRVPTALALLATPLLGLAYVVVLPVAGVASLGLGLLRRLTGRAAEGASDLAAAVSPDVATGAAYLTGAEGDEKDAAAGQAEPGAATPELERLRQEIEEKRS
ncbi:MAG: hypothetical protein IPO09_09275 [Anaeromyxobacter sp.]|nr:hypothetical protein [Anaeromyxobacter sp.]MBL0278696.1 hypothetical protein [Anaeromyxobacter sp.]